VFVLVRLGGESTGQSALLNISKNRLSFSPWQIERTESFFNCYTITNNKRNQNIGTSFGRRITHQKRIEFVKAPSQSFFKVNLVHISLVEQERVGKKKSF